MNLPALVLSPYSAQLGVFSYLFALVAITDLIPLLERNYMFFESIVPFRLMIFFLVTATSFVMKDNLYLHNNVVFVYGFVEIWLNFLAFSALREEKNERFANEKRIIAADYLSEETNDTEEVSTGLEGEYEEEFEQLETIAEEEEEL
ncbi:uncharacterized protein SCODWIG_01465 [Saccharomycodes ludwigii]|uniref:Protein ILM1 n=2 Tax=Saccharomycodes ludwigii TaxID=36035 RepID=A0A376B5F1_9ASCO|nr:uncharacterized protein SCODWIG_01465 [Saccharomycodes ludwigii]